MKRFLIILALLMITVFANSYNSARASSAISAPVLINTSPITSGAVLKEFLWVLPNGPVRLFVIEVDLTNPLVRVDSIPGAGRITQRLNVSAMANNSGAVAAVNGDFFNTLAEGAPIGPMVSGGRLISSPSVISSLFALGVSALNESFIEAFTFSGRAIAPNGHEFPLSGLNQAVYREVPSGIHSHVNRLHLYNDMWGGLTRGHDAFTTPTEMLISNGIVVDIVRGGYISGTIPEGMYILRGHRQAASFLTENFKIGDAVHIEYSISPDNNWRMIVGGHGLLVDEGRAVTFEQIPAALGGERARTAAGISMDRKTLFLVSAERRTNGSRGLTLPDLAGFLEAIGVWRAVNLDGGGSTTMVARPLGEVGTRQVFSPEQPNERMVVNAIGVFSDAPQGTLKNLVVSSLDRVLLVGEEVALTIRAVDEFFNPAAVDPLSISAVVTGDAGILHENRFVAKQPGIAEIVVSSGDVSSQQSIEVIGRKDVERLDVVAGNIGVLTAGRQIPLTVLLQTVMGKNRVVAPDLVDWQFVGFKGAVSGAGVLTVTEIGNFAHGFLVARYQGFSVPLFVQLRYEIVSIQPRSVLVMTVGEKSLSINGETKEMDVAPFVVNGRTMVPIRFVSEALGANVTWDAQTKNATISKSGRWIDLWTGEDMMVVNGTRTMLDVIPFVQNGRNMLPLRAVANALNLSIHYDAVTRQITLR